MVEALAAGAPVIALDAGGARDIVRDGVDGVLVERADGRDPARRRRPGRRRRLGPRGAERARRRVLARRLRRADAGAAGRDDGRRRRRQPLLDCAG